MWRAIEPAIEFLTAGFRGRPNLRQLYAPIVSEKPDPGLAGESFEPGKSYFTLRLVELRLATAGRYLTEFLPMCTCVLSFQQVGEKRTIPFIAGVDMIRGLVGPNAPADAAKRIAFANLAVAHNIPVPGGDLTMYLSLCRFKDSSLLRGLLDLASKTAAAVGGPVAGPMVKTATDFAGSLMNILSSDGVETRFGRLEGNALGKSGYRILAGFADDSLNPENLYVNDGQLFRRAGGKNAAIDDVDYLMLAFEHRSTLKDETFSLIENLPFHAHWRAAADNIVRSRGASGAADAEMIELRSAILQSPQLTETDRLPLLQLYDVKREQFEAQFTDSKKKAGGALGLLNSLQQRVQLEHQRGGEISTLLSSARAAVSDVINSPRDGASETQPSGKEMAATFDKLLEGQRERLASATPKELAATARAYVAATARL